MDISVFFRDSRPKIDPKDITIEELKGETVGRLPGTINGTEFIIRNCEVLWGFSYGLFTLTETSSGIDSDSDSKSDGYIALIRPWLHCMDSDSEAHWLFLYRNLSPESVSESVSGNVNEPLRSAWTSTLKELLPAIKIGFGISIAPQIANGVRFVLTWEVLFSTTVSGLQ